MKFLKTYNQLFENAVTQENLYHLVDNTKLNYIIDNDVIDTYTAGDGKISTTRNLMLNGYLGDNVTTLFKLVLDWNKLEEDYDSKPFVYRSQTGVSFDSEEEQQIQTRSIDNVWKYVKCVVLIKEKVEKLKNSPIDNEPTDWFTTIGGNGGNLPTIIKDFKKKLDDKGIPFYTQNGSVIEKDSIYIDSVINYQLKQIDEKWIIAYKGRIVGKDDFDTNEILVDNGGTIIMNDISFREEIDSSKFDLIEFDNLKSVKNQLKNFLEIKQFPQHTISKYEKGFEPYLIKLEHRKGKWLIDDYNSTNWVITSLNNSKMRKG